MNSIHTSWVERFYIILFAVLGPASEKNLTQSKGPNFSCEDKQQENLSRKKTLSYKTQMQPQSELDNFSDQSKGLHVGQNSLKCPWKGVYRRAVGKGTIAGFEIDSDSFTPVSHMQVLLMLRML